MQNGSKLIVLVQDPFIPSTFPNESLKSIRDIFKDDLEYVLYYWKDKSSGKVGLFCGVCCFVCDSYTTSMVY